jgi:hypothetical protein
MKGREELVGDRELDALRSACCFNWPALTFLHSLYRSDADANFAIISIFLQRANTPLPPGVRVTLTCPPLPQTLDPLALDSLAVL